VSRKIIGLDIRDNSVSALLLKSGIKKSRIEEYIHIPIDNKHISQNSSEDEESQKESNSGLITALERIKERIDITDAVCIVSLPANFISYRNIRLPFKDTKKIRQILPFELESTLPFPADDLILDFQILTDNKIHPDLKSETEIIVAAVEKIRLKSYLDILAGFHIDPETITVGGYSTALSVKRFADVPEKWLFADIDEKRCTLFAVISGEISLIRSFPVSSVPDSASHLCSDIQRTLVGLEEIFDADFQPSEIYVSGYSTDALQSRNFEKELEYRLGIPVKDVDICSDAGVEIKTQMNQAQINNPLALALAEMEGFALLNFRRGEFAPRREWAENKGTLIRTMLLTGLITGFFFLNVMTDIYSKEKQVKRLDKEINEIFKATFPDITKVVDPLHQMRVAMDDLKKDDMLPGDTKNIRVIDILGELSRLISDKIDVEFTQTVITDDNIQISGKTDSFNAVDDMQNQLQKSAMFKKITISNTSKEKIGNKIQFKIRIDL